MIDDKQLSLMVSQKIPEIIMRLTKELEISSDEAFELFYNSETYRLLCDKGTYYWGESPLFVTDSFLREHNNMPIEEFDNI